MKKRWKEIVEKTNQAGSITVYSLSKEIGVSEVTIRKDLSELEKRNLLTRNHGGASSLQSIVPSFSHRELIEKKEKEKIALKVSKLIEDGDSVLIDAGTTPLAVAEKLKERKISIITNSIPVGIKLTNSNSNISFTGGEMSKENMGLYGPDAEDYLENLKVNKLILGASGLNLDEGLTTSSSLEMSMKKSMVKSAKTVIAVFDHSKFTKMKPFVFAGFNDIDVIVTTGKVPLEICKILKNRNIELIVSNEEDKHVYN